MTDTSIRRPARTDGAGKGRESYMDELIAVGTAGLVGLAVTAILVIAGIWWLASQVWTAVTAENWDYIYGISLLLLLLITGYTLTGLWLRKTGKI